MVRNLRSRETLTMAITGAHMLLYTTEPDLLRGVLRDVFGWKHVDAGDGWLIFALPPAELGVHPAEGPTFESGMRHQITFMCDDIGATIRDLRGKGITVTGEPQDEGYGITAMLLLPGGVEVMLYEPRHPVAARLAAASGPRARRTSRLNVRAKKKAGRKAPAGRRRPARGRGRNGRRR
jgi:predicted enzyme related to lactoylglutathione lyase